MHQSKKQKKHESATLEEKTQGKSECCQLFENQEELDNIIEIQLFGLLEAVMKERNQESGEFEETGEEEKQLETTADNNVSSYKEKLEAIKQETKLVKEKMRIDMEKQKQVQEESEELLRKMKADNEELLSCKDPKERKLYRFMAEHISKMEMYDMMMRVIEKRPLPGFWDDDEDSEPPPEEQENKQ